MRLDKTKPNFYVLGVKRGVWVLNPEGRPYAACERAINWQGKGYDNDEIWVICKYDKTLDMFVAVNGDRQYPVPEHGIYTQEAWYRYVQGFKDNADA